MTAAHAILPIWCCSLFPLSFAIAHPTLLENQHSWNQVISIFQFASAESTHLIPFRAFPRQNFMQILAQGVPIF